MSSADCKKKHGAGYAICSPAFMAFLLMNDLVVLNCFERGNFCFQIVVYVLLIALKVNNNLFGRQKKRTGKAVGIGGAICKNGQMKRIEIRGVLLRYNTAWKKAEKALLKARNKLKERVKERTSELSNVNVQLRRKIQRRKNWKPNRSDPEKNCGCFRNTFKESVKTKGNASPVRFMMNLAIPKGKRAPFQSSPIK